MKVYHYRRTTAFEAGEHQDSESVQQMWQEVESVSQYCRNHGLGAPVVYEDEDVAWTQDFAHREKAGEMLERFQAGDVLLAYSIERIFSSCEDTFTTLTCLRARGVHLIVLELGGDITQADLARDFTTMLQIFAGLERRRGAERIKLVKLRQRERGRYLGGSRPFGYMIHENGRLLENPMEQRVLKRIMLLKQQGRSLRAIAAEVSTPLVPVSFKTVQRVLQRHAQ